MFTHNSVVLAVVITVMLVGATVSAQQVGVGTSNMEGYDALYLAASSGAYSFYGEHQIGEGDYGMMYLKYRVNDRMKAVVRLEDPDWVRLAVEAKVGGGKSTFLLRPFVPVAGDAPLMLDVFTPSWRLTPRASIDGWVRLKDNASPNWWVGPSVKFGQLGAWYRLNLRESGPWVGGVDLTVLTW